MCGIMGYIGEEKAVDVVLTGLSRLEYRGYDSSGICFRDDRKLVLIKKAGKLENLKRTFNGEGLTSHICVGHTRWATHGQVNDQNAHPHSNGEVAIVHNGIIENAMELKEYLISKGFVFQSDEDSDTEVFLGLISMELKNGVDLKEAICHSFVKIKGNSAFVIQNKNTDEIYAVKRGAPLVCGINEKGEAAISSDSYALSELTDNLYFPEDNTLCHLKKDNLRFYNMKGELNDRYYFSKRKTGFIPSTKENYEHFMLKEIFEQPNLIRELGKFYLSGNGKDILAQIQNIRPDRIHILACGTAFYAALLIKNYLEQMAFISCSVDLASEFRYNPPLLTHKDMGILISQSGETADTLAAEQLCRQKGMKTLAIVNVEDSTLSRNAHYCLPIRAGTEIAVASTKAFSLMALTGRILACALNPNGDDLRSRFDLLANRMEELLARVDTIKSIAKELLHIKAFFYTGRGIYYPIALEGALKLKEVAYVHAEGYASGELKHGPIALIEKNVVNMAIIGPELFEKTLSNVQEIKARQGIIVGMGSYGNRDVEKTSDYTIPLDFHGLKEISPLYVNVINQVFAYYFAYFKGHDIDRPRNLAKSVTVE